MCSSAKKVVLVVDDEPDLADIMAFDLNEAGYDVVIAASGRAALKIIDEQPIDVVVSDIRMPNGDGIELLNALRARSPSQPEIMFATAHADVEVENFYDMGAVAIFIKPVNPDRLLEIIRSVLQERSLRWKESAGPDKLRVKMEVSVEGVDSLKLGRGGAFIQLPPEQIPAVNQLIEFRAAFNQGPLRVLEGRGIVRWIRKDSLPLPSGIGVEFRELSDQCRQLCIAYIEQQKTVKYIPKS